MEIQTPLTIQIENIKAKLRLWEQKFSDKFKRLPEKSDVKKYPAVIAEYKLYEQLKLERKRALTSKLNDRTYSDDSGNQTSGRTILPKGTKVSIMTMSSPNSNDIDKENSPNIECSEEVVNSTPVKRQKTKISSKLHLHVSPTLGNVFSKNLNKVTKLSEDEFDNVMEEIIDEDFRTLLPLLSIHGDSKKKGSPKPKPKTIQKENPNDSIIVPNLRMMGRLRKVEKHQIDFRTLLGEEEMKELDALAFPEKSSQSQGNICEDFHNDGLKDTNLSSLQTPPAASCNSNVTTNVENLDPEVSVLSKELLHVSEKKATKKSVKRKATTINRPITSDAEDSKANPKKKSVAGKSTTKNSSTNSKPEIKKVVISKAPKSVSNNFVSLNLRNASRGGSHSRGGKGGKFNKFRSQANVYSYAHGNNFEIEENVNDVHSEEDPIPDRFQISHHITSSEITFIGDVNTSTDSEHHLISPEHFSFTDPIDLKKALRTLFKFEDFRKGQLETVSRMLLRKSTLTVLPTGSGKSLCYQLPSFILKACAQIKNEKRTASEAEVHGITLVITPTIALMLDQLQNMPAGLRAAALCAQTLREKSGQNHDEIFLKLENNKLDILFISPERLQSPQFIKFVDQGRMPRIWLTCIDEAHCLSEWSHNFRPSYLHVSNILRLKLNVGCVLAMTGTATKAVQREVSEMLGLNDADLVASDIVRYNLKLKVSKFKEEREKDLYLIDLFQTVPFKDMSSVIIYTMFQSQADKLASVLRIHNIQAESYHAGKENKERQHIQQKFMTGRIRILVATIAFGLGMDKKDIRSVIHYTLPSSLENYVQEIGRAGRDGEDAHCRLLLSTNDYLILRRFAYSEGMEASTLRKFLLRVLCAADLSDGKRNSALLFNIAQMEKDFDLKQSVMSTILNYIEIETEGQLKVAQETFIKYRINFTKTNFETLLETNSWLQIVKSHAVAERKSAQKVLAHTSMTIYEFTKKLVELREKKEIVYEGLEKAFCIYMCNQAENIQDRLEELTNAIHEKIRVLEISKVAKLDKAYTIFNNIVDSKLEENEESLEIHRQITAYFSEEHISRKTGLSDTDLVEKNMNTKQQAAIDVSLFVQENAQLISNGRIVGRIFHGISSPQFPSSEWFALFAYDSFQGRNINTGRNIPLWILVLSSNGQTEQ